MAGMMAGAVLAAAMVIDQIFQSTDAWMLTLANADGPDPLRWFYDPSDIKTFAMAVILVLFGAIMRHAIAVDRENREFV